MSPVDASVFRHVFTGLVVNGRDEGFETDTEWLDHCERIAEEVENRIGERNKRKGRQR